MESMHSMSEILFNQVEQIADVKTCNVDNVEQKYYKVQWKCTWEPATVLERFCSKMIEDYNKHPQNSENTKHDDGMTENNVSIDIVEKSVIDVEKCETEQFEDTPNLFSPSNNLNDSEQQNFNREIDKEDSQIASNLLDKLPSEIYAANNESLSCNDYNSANNFKQHNFDSVNNLACNNFSIKPDPDQELFPNINILCESNPITFNYQEESNTTSNDQNNELSTPHVKADSKTSLCNNLTTSKNITVVSKIRRNSIKPESCFKCNICSYSTLIKSTLKRHMQNHTVEKPFKCQLCTYSTSQKSDIKRHMRRHTGEKPFKCSECSFSTSRQGTIKTHMSQHTGDYPFKCRLCSYSTSRNVYLKKHIISKHKDLI